MRSETTVKAFIEARDDYTAWIETIQDNLPSVFDFYRQVAEKFPALLNGFSHRFISDLNTWVSNSKDDELVFREFTEEYANDHQEELNQFVFYPGWFTHDKTWTFADIYLSGVTFAGCNLSGSHFERMIMKMSNCARSDMAGMNIINSTVEFVDFERANMEMSVFKNTQVSYCRFNEAILNDSKIRLNSRVFGNSFQQASLRYLLVGKGNGDNTEFEANDYWKADLFKSHVRCSSQLESGVYLNSQAGAAVDASYSKVFPGNITSDGTSCGDTHAQQAKTQGALLNSTVSMISAFGCDANFEHGKVGENATMYGKSGYAGILALSAQGGLTHKMSPTLCNKNNWEMPVIYLGFVIGAIGIVALVLVCIYRQSRANANHDVEVGNDHAPHVQAVAENPPPLNERAPLLPKGKNSEPPAGKNEQRYKAIQAKLRIILQKLETHHSEIEDKNKSKAIKKLKEHAENLRQSIKDEKRNYTCSINLSDVMDNPAFVTGEATMAEYFRLLQHVVTNKKGLEIRDQEITCEDIVEARPVRSTINQWLEKYEKKASQLEEQCKELIAEKNLLLNIQDDPMMPSSSSSMRFA